MVEIQDKIDILDIILVNSINTARKSVTVTPIGHGPVICEQWLLLIL